MFTTITWYGLLLVDEKSVIADIKAIMTIIMITCEYVNHLIWLTAGRWEKCDKGDDHLLTSKAHRLRDRALYHHDVVVKEGDSIY